MYAGAPVSLIVQSDRSINEDELPLSDFWAPTRDGGRVFDANLNEALLARVAREDAADALRPFPTWFRLTGGAATTGAENDVGASAAARSSGRADLMMCCCMRLHAYRFVRLQILDGVGGCPSAATLRSWDVKKTNKCPAVTWCTSSKDEYRARLLRAEFVWAPSGVGWAEIRFQEILHAGAIPVMDEYVADHFASAGRALFANMPVVHVRATVCDEHAPSAFLWKGGKYWCQNLTEVVNTQALHETLRVAQRDAERYDMSRLYWPFWLHEVTRNMMPGLRQTP